MVELTNRKRNHNKRTNQSYELKGNADYQANIQFSSKLMLLFEY